MEDFDINIDDIAVEDFADLGDYDLGQYDVPSYDIDPGGTYEVPDPNAEAARRLALPPPEARAEAKARAARQAARPPPEVYAEERDTTRAVSDLLADSRYPDATNYGSRQTDEQNAASIIAASQNFIDLREKIKNSPLRTETWFRALQASNLPQYFKNELSGWGKGREYETGPDKQKDERDEFDQRLVSDFNRAGGTAGGLMPGIRDQGDWGQVVSFDQQKYLDATTRRLGDGARVPLAGQALLDSLRTAYPERFEPYHSFSPFSPSMKGLSQDAPALLASVALPTAASALMGAAKFFNPDPNIGILDGYNITSKGRRGEDWYDLSAKDAEREQWDVEMYPPWGRAGEPTGIAAGLPPAQIPGAPPLGPDGEPIYDPGRRGQYATQRTRLPGGDPRTAGFRKVPLLFRTPMQLLGFNKGGMVTGVNRGGRVKERRMRNDAAGLASLGRGGDTMLVHMRPDEVAAMSMDGRTTVNPQTGLPERFWGSTLGALGGSFFGPVGVGIGSGLGQFAQQKLAGRRTGDALQQGLYTGALAGLGSYGLGKYAQAGVGTKEGSNWFQKLLGAGEEGTRVMTGEGQFAKLLGNEVPLMTAGLAGMGGSMLGEMATPPLPIPEEEPITQPQAFARPRRSRYVSDPKRYGFGSEQYMFDRNKGIYDYTFAQEGGLMELANQEMVEAGPDEVGIASVEEEITAPESSGLQGMEEGMDVVVEEAVRAIRGEHPHPERAITEYIAIYGEEDFEVLKQMVEQDQTLEQMAGPPAEMIEETQVTEETEEVPVMAARGGRLEGPGKGRDDQIPVLASDGEYIVAADVVSGLGDGSTKAGAQTLDAMADRVRHMRTGTEKQPEILSEEAVLPV